MKLNCVKTILESKGISQTWLAKQLGKDKATISKWCTNTNQPDINTLMHIALLFDVDVSELLRMEEYRSQNSK